MNVLYPDQIPERQHLAALVFSKVYVVNEGPKTIIEYFPFENRSEMEEWVIEQETARGEKVSYQIIESCPKNVRVTVAMESAAPTYR